MMSIFSARQHAVQVIFDIGSGSVGGAIVSKRKSSAKPRIHFFTRVPFSGSSAQALEKSVGVLCERFRDVLLKNQFSLHGDIRCFVGAPWYAPLLERINHVESESFLVSAKKFETILENREKTLKEKARVASDVSNDYALFERRILDLALQGYHVDKPLGKRTRRLEFTLFTAKMDKEVASLLTTFARLYFDRAVLFHARSLSLFTVLNDSETIDDSYALFDIHSDITEILIANREAPLAVHAIPIGFKTLARHFAEKKKSTVEEALSTFKLASQKGGLLDKSSKEYKLLEELGAQWGSAMSAFLRSAYVHNEMTRFFIITRPSISPWFEALIASKIGGKGGKPVIALGSEKTHRFAETRPRQGFDPALLMEAFHVSRL